MTPQPSHKISEKKVTLTKLKDVDVKALVDELLKENQSQQNINTYVSEQHFFNFVKILDTGGNKTKFKNFLKSGLELDFKPILFTLTSIPFLIFFSISLIGKNIQTYFIFAIIALSLGFFLSNILNLIIKKIKTNKLLKGFNLKFNENNDPIKVVSFFSIFLNNISKYNTYTENEKKEILYNAFNYSAQGDVNKLQSIYFSLLEHMHDKHSIIENFKKICPGEKIPDIFTAKEEIEKNVKENIEEIKINRLLKTNLSFIKLNKENIEENSYIFIEKIIKEKMKVFFSIKDIQMFFLMNIMPFLLIPNQIALLVFLLFANLPIIYTLYKAKKSPLYNKDYLSILIGKKTKEKIIEFRAILELILYSPQFREVYSEKEINEKIQQGMENYMYYDNGEVFIYNLIDDYTKKNTNKENSVITKDINVILNPIDRVQALTKNFIVK